MIDALAGKYSANARPAFANPLSADQKAAVAQILSGFDAKTLTAQSAQAITSKVKDLGISPGIGLAQAFSEAGFDAREIGDLAGVKPLSTGGVASEGRGRASLDETLVALMSEVADAHQSAEAGAFDFYDALKSKLEENGYTLSQTNIDFYV